jgi:hypothetical protein
MPVHCRTPTCASTIEVHDEAECRAGARTTAWWPTSSILEDHALDGGTCTGNGGVKTLVRSAWLPPIAAASMPRVSSEADRKDIQYDQEREQNEQFHHRHAFH